jgi:hypothetical protein
LTRQKVGRSIRALQASGELLASAPGASDMDQTKAYRVSAHQQCSPVNDEGRSDRSVLNIAGHECSDLNGTGSLVNGYRFTSEHSSYMGELEERGERRGSAKDQADQTLVLPDSVTPQPYPADNGKAASNGARSLDEKRFQNLCACVPVEPPPRTCKKHAHWDGPHRCPTCGKDRGAFRQWHADTIGVLGELARLRDNTRIPGLSKTIANNRTERLYVLDDLNLSRERADQ